MGPVRVVSCSFIHFVSSKLDATAVIASTPSGVLTIDSSIISVRGRASKFHADTWSILMIIYTHSCRPCIALPTDSGYVDIYSSGEIFAAVKADGSITLLGSGGLKEQRFEAGHVQLFAAGQMFAALKYVCPLSTLRFL